MNTCGADIQHDVMFKLVQICSVACSVGVLDVGLAQWTRNQAGLVDCLAFNGLVAEREARRLSCSLRVGSLLIVDLQHGSETRDAGCAII